MSMLKQRLQDNFITHWYQEIRNSSTYQLYKEFKVNFGFEDYLVNIVNYKYRYALSKLRLSSHLLSIETGKFSKNSIPRDRRLCIYCNHHELENEFHFLLQCPIYSELRRIYIKKYYYNHYSVYKCIQLLSSRNVNIQRSLSKYVYYAFQLRNNT